MSEEADPQIKIAEQEIRSDPNVSIPKTKIPDISTWEGKMFKARNEYMDFYEEDSATWNKLDFEERFKYLIQRLAAQGIIFAEPEKIILRTALRNSTVRMWTKAKDVDAHDGPDNPMKIAEADRKAKKAAAVIKKNPPDSQIAA